MSDKYIPEHRRNQYKAKSTFKPDELRRRREEAQVEIRKAKREENLAKRRGIGTGADRPGASLGAAPDSDDDSAPTESQVSPSIPDLYEIQPSYAAIHCASGVYLYLYLYLYLPVLHALWFYNPALF